MKRITPKQRQDLRARLQLVNRALHARWQRAGGPVHSTEPLLWDGYRVLDMKRPPSRELVSLLDETTRYLVDWLDCTTEPLPKVRALVSEVQSFLPRFLPKEPA